MEEQKKETEKKEDTNLQAPAVKTKMVKVKAIRDFRRGVPGNPMGELITAGSIVELPEEEAKVVCRVHEGPFSYFGERHDDSGKQRHLIVNAERVAKTA